LLQPVKNSLNAWTLNLNKDTQEIRFDSTVGFVPVCSPQYGCELATAIGITTPELGTQNPVSERL